MPSPPIRVLSVGGGRGSGGFIVVGAMGAVAVGVPIVAALVVGYLEGLAYDILTDPVSFRHDLEGVDLPFEPNTRGCSAF